MDEKGKGLEYVYGAILLNPEFGIPILKNDKISSEIIDEIVCFLLDFFKTFDFPIFRSIEKIDSKYSNLNKYISNMFVETYPERGILWWEKSLKSGKIQCGINDVKSSIEEKERKKYDFSDCNEKWLLLCAESSNLGNSVILQEEDFSGIKINKLCNFDKVFYWSRFLENIFQIYPKFKMFLSNGKYCENSEEEI